MMFEGKSESLMNGLKKMQQLDRSSPFRLAGFQSNDARFDVCPGVEAKG